MLQFVAVFVRYCFTCTWHVCVDVVCCSVLRNVAVCCSVLQCVCAPASHVLGMCVYAYASMHIYMYVVCVCVCVSVYMWEGEWSIVCALLHVYV